MSKSNLAELNRQILAASLPDLLLIVREKCQEFNDVNISTALHCLVRKHANPFTKGDETIGNLLKRVCQVLEKSTKLSIRSLTTIIWCIGKKQLFQINEKLQPLVVKAIDQNKDKLDGQGISNSFWTLAIFSQADYPVQPTIQRVLAEKIVGTMVDMNSQEISNVLWAMAVLNYRDTSLLAKLSLHIQKHPLTFTAQGISNLVWSYAKLKVKELPLFIHAASVALPLLPTFDQQSLSNILWAFVSSELDHPDFYKAAMLRLNSLVAILSTKSLSSLVWSLSRLQHSEDTFPKLFDRAMTLIDKLDPQELGFLASAYLSNRAKVTLTADQFFLLKKRFETVYSQLPWRTFGLLELVLWEGGQYTDAKIPNEALCKHISTLAKNLRSSAFARNSGPQKLLLQYLPSFGLKKGKSALIVGDDMGGEVYSALQKLGITVYHWRRWEGKSGPEGICHSEANSPSVWPVLPDQIREKTGGKRSRKHDDEYELQGCQLVVPAPVHYCFLRYPNTGSGSYSFLLNGIAQVLRSKGKLWIYSDDEEGSLRNDEKLFTSAKQIGSSNLTGSICKLYSLSRRSKASPKPLEDFVSKSKIEIDDKVTSWSSMPGLFAGGGIDVMTDALLNLLPPIPSNLTIVDYACGSGVIARAIMRRQKSSTVIGLDADCVAMEAFRINVKSAIACLTDGWPSKSTKDVHPALLPDSKSIDWIVSNPPVHNGLPDDLAVVQDLIDGAISRLKKGGKMLVVAQAHVPMGRLLTLPVSSSGKTIFRNIQVKRDPSGRFGVWSCERS